MAEAKEEKKDQGKPGSPLQEFSKVAKKLDFAKQAQFFLNAMWSKHQEKAEEIYETVTKFRELNELQESRANKNFKKNDGKALGSFLGNRLLELIGETVTALELKKILKDIDVDSDGFLSFMEFAVWKYKVDIKYLMEQPQGTNQALEDAQEALGKVQKEINKIEKKKRILKKKAEKDGGTSVKAKMAKNELEQLLAADPLELNKALVTAQAAVRKAQKSDKLAAPGAKWWIERDLAEMKKYKPGKKNKTKKSFKEVMGSK